MVSLLINVVFVHPSQYTLAPPNPQLVPTPLCSNRLASIECVQIENTNPTPKCDLKSQ